MGNKDLAHFCCGALLSKGFVFQACEWRKRSECDRNWNQYGSGCSLGLSLLRIQSQNHRTFALVNVRETYP